MLTAFALAFLLSAEPIPAPPPPPPSEPAVTVTAPAAAPPAPAAVAAPVAAPVPAPAEQTGAPLDDYGFVAWCEGALGGHMALYDLVRPQLDEMVRKEEAGDDIKENARIDAERMAAGREYLQLYEHALKVADIRTHGRDRARADKARTIGQGIWFAARAAEPNTRMWSWLMWELPARCEIAAHALEKQPARKGRPKASH